MCRFRRNFRGVPWVCSPVIHWGCSSTCVLTMEYLPGIKISDVGALRAAGLDTGVVARRATEAYLMQVMVFRVQGATTSALINAVLATLKDCSMLAAWLACSEYRHQVMYSDFLAGVAA